MEQSQWKKISHKSSVTPAALGKHVQSLSVFGQFQGLVSGQIRLDVFQVLQMLKTDSPPKCTSPAMLCLNC